MAEVNTIMQKRSNILSDSKAKQDDTMKERMEDTNTTSNHNPCTYEEIHRDHEHRITILESKSEQQGKDLKKLDIGLWEMLNKIDGKVDEISIGLGKIGITNGKQDKDIDCIKQEMKEGHQDKRDKEWDKQQNKHRNKWLIIVAILSIIGTMIVEFILKIYFG